MPCQSNDGTFCDSRGDTRHSLKEMNNRLSSSSRVLPCAYDLIESHFVAIDLHLQVIIIIIMERAHALSRPNIDSVNRL